MGTLYYIDGYNLLFRSFLDESKLADVRQQIIKNLNEMAAFLKLEIILVFDAQHQMGDSSRSHYQHLEILFSAYGETADELILEEIKSKKYPKTITVVTSDKKLAWFARRCSARTESVEDFLNWLNRRYQNKIRRNEQEDSKQDQPAKKIKSPEKKKHIPQASSSPEECYDFYLSQFEDNLKVIEQEKMPPHPQVKPEQKRDVKRTDSINDMERWLKLFEDRSE